MIVLRHDGGLDLEAFWRVARDHEPVEIDSEALRHVGERRKAMEAHLGSGASAYGVTTGLGYFADRPIAPAEQTELQRAILVGRAAGVGPPLGEHVVRGTMLLRLMGFLTGHAAVTPNLCTFIAERLNSSWYPVVPASRSGTAGETTPLCHLFQTLIGEGGVLMGGVEQSADDALRSAGVEPYELQLKEGLALINGAPLAAALGADAARRCDLLLDAATVTAALTASVIGASSRPYSPRIAELKGDPGQREVTGRIADLLAGGGHDGDGPQAPVSLRVLPQVHGAAADVVNRLRRQVERELRAVTDSPLYFDAVGDEPEGFYPSGNFHSQALSFDLDSSAIAMTQVAALSEKRLHRMLDSRFSGLPDQLAADSTRGGSGLVSLHKAVVGLAAENRMLASPASIHSADTSTGQEDFQAYTGLGASKLATLLDNVELTLACELVAARQACALGAEPAPRLAPLAELLAARLAPVTADRSLAPDVEAAAELVRSGAVSNVCHRHID